MPIASIHLIRSSAATLLVMASGCATLAPRAQATEAPAPVPQPMCTMPACMMPMGAMARAAQMGGWHPSSAYGQLYFQGKPITLAGNVIEVGPLIPRQGMMQGLQLRLKTNEGEKIIHLGPSWYIQQQEFALKTGDKVNVEGRMVGEGKDSSIFAAKIQHNEDTLILRDDQGFPFWSGVRARGRMGPVDKGERK